MIRTIIVEDEQPILNAISEILTNYCHDIEIIGTAKDVESAIQIIGENSPDLVLLDINLPGGTSFDIFPKLKDINFKIIFITAFEEFAIKAIKFSAIDYLVKPVDPQELISAVNKAIKTIEADMNRLQLETLLYNIKTMDKKLEKIVIRTSESIFFLNIQEIIRCEADGSYCKFFLNDNRKIMVSKVLKEYDDMLSDSGFLRVHQSHIINLNYIDRYDKNDGGYLVLKDKTVIPVSYRKKEQILSFLLDQGKHS